jgi:RNA polymerase sigma-70 factor (ECF subfamily)
VLDAGKGTAADAQAALAALCQTYWYPLYTYVRRQGHQPDDAQDLTQAFFSQLLEKHYLQSADPERGQFRSFLLTAFKRFPPCPPRIASANKSAFLPTGVVSDGGPGPCLVGNVGALPSSLALT